jgi:hypothetical protein
MTMEYREIAPQRRCPLTGDYRHMQANFSELIRPAVRRSHEGEHGCRRLAFRRVGQFSVGILSM